MDAKTYNRIANRIVSLEAHLDNHIEFIAQGSDGRYVRDEKGNLVPIAVGTAGVGATAYGARTLRRGIINRYGKFDDATGNMVAEKGMYKNAFSPVRNAEGAIDWAGTGSKGMNTLRSSGDVVRGDYNAIKSAPGKIGSYASGKYGAAKGAAKDLVKKGAGKVLSFVK